MKKFVLSEKTSHRHLPPFSKEIGSIMTDYLKRFIDGANWADSIF